MHLWLRSAALHLGFEHPKTRESARSEMKPRSHRRSFSGYAVEHTTTLFASMRSRRMLKATQNIWKLVRGWTPIRGGDPLTGCYMASGVLSRYFEYGQIYLLKPSGRHSFWLRATHARRVLRSAVDTSGRRRWQRPTAGEHLTSWKRSRWRRSRSWSSSD